jgi:drug/metabolite transporter (DMT)-like permease
MSVAAAYLGIILIWSTTPLAIKWSSEGSSFIFGITSRMLLGTIVCVIIAALFKMRIRWNRKSVVTYLAASMATYGSMISVYWGSQFISSGLLSVLFGMTPLLTGLFAAWLLNEHSLGFSKILGIVLGIAGLAIIFQENLGQNNNAILGIAAVLFATTLHALSTVLVKKFGTELGGFQLNTGSLLISSLLLVTTWLLSGSGIPGEITLKAGSAIVYLGIFGSVIGFTLYYYALRNMDASRISLIPLITPVIALLLGYGLNNEKIAASIWIGTALILSGLMSHQWGNRFRRLLIQKL